VLKEQFDLDVWTEHFGVGHKVDVRGSRSTLAPLRQSLACDVVVRDLAQQMYEENKARERHLLAKGKDAGFFDDYHTYEEIQQYYIDLSRNYPNLVTYIPSIGISNEGRDLFAIRIKSHANPPKTIYFEGLIHAREWISGATVAYTVQHISFFFFSFAQSDTAILIITFCVGNQARRGLRQRQRHHDHPRPLRDCRRPDHQPRRLRVLLDRRPSLAQEPPRERGCHLHRC